jgi:hypothetical protein
MNLDQNLRLPFGLTLVVTAMLALTACSGDGRDNAADAIAGSSANNDVAASATTPPPAAATDNSAGMMEDEDRNREAAMERHHKQEMDHADMRMGGMKPDADQQNDSQPAPMKDM